MASNKWNHVVSAQHLSSVMAVTALCQTNLLPGSKSGLTDTSNIYSFDGALSWGINGNFNVCSSQENGANIWLGALGKVEQYLKGTSKLTGTVEKVCGSWVHVSELRKPADISQPGLLQNSNITKGVFPWKIITHVILTFATSVLKRRDSDVQVHSVKWILRKVQGLSRAVHRREVSLF